jgi:hypothetical protein
MQAHHFVSSLLFSRVRPHHVRVALVTLFAVMVEMRATLGLFAALSHSSQKTAAVVSRWRSTAS